MPSISEASIRGVLTQEQITPGTDLARFTSKALSLPSFQTLPPAEKAAAFALKNIERETQKFMAPIVYGHFMAVMIFRGYLDAQWFPPGDVQRWRSDRIDRMTQLWGGDPRPDYREIAAKVERYEAILAGICNLLGVPAQPPDYGDLLNKIPNTLLNNPQ